jgi:hypothetical protein
MAQKIKITHTSNADMNIGIPKNLTAVEWLYERFLFAGYAAPGEWKEKAKEMEKEQTKTAFIHGSLTGCGCYDYMEDVDADEYYNNRYGKDKPNNEKG